MSTMLEQAIIDAEALKEAAVQNAEQIVIEKYQTEIKEAVETLLEQDPMEEDPLADPMADPLGAGEEIPETDEELAQQIPLASTEGAMLCPCPGEEEEIEIDFDQLAAQMKAEEEDEEGPGGDALDMSAPIGSPLMEGEVEEEVELNEEELLDILEELTLDMEPTQSGWLQRPTPQVEYEIDLLQAKTPVELDIEVDEDEPEESTKYLSESLKKAEKQITTLKNNIKERTEENVKYKQILLQMRDTLNEVNLQNAKLLYTNQALGDVSLNERQKKTIAEAIAKSGSVEEAKTIFEALQSTVGKASVSRRRAPKSLGEAVERRSLTLPHNRGEKDKSYNFSDRMKLLAGIN